jgi:DNA-binding IclR family transcriptional regulator
LTLIRRSVLRVLELIADDAGDIGLTELSTQLDESVTVIFRILRTLVGLGYLNQCQEPSWLENIELRTEKAIKRENDRQRIFSRLMALPRRSSISLA